ncbi:hypothetical protein FOA52_016265 [Chlamydomonas sp. UWO 241]|nr:hypothetical protein FOA52_016265 [Chlamydomonas sp. UWO 241]
MGRPANGCGNTDENLLDSSHVPFTHHVSMSNRNVLAAYDMELTSAVGPAGFTGNWATGPRGGKLGPQSTEFRAPGYMKHKLVGNVFNSLVIVYAVPTSPGRCRLINRNVVKFAGGPPALISKLLRYLPGWYGHVSSHVLLEDDQIFLHEGEIELFKRRAAGGKYGALVYTPSQADTYVIALHRWLELYGGGGPFGKVDDAYVARMGPRQSRLQLLDRMSQHTENCAQCTRGRAQAASLARALTAVRDVLRAAALLCGAAAALGSVALPADPAAASGQLPSSGLALLVGGGSGGPEAAALRALFFAVASLAAGVAAGVAGEVEARFVSGVYPPPRNLAKD